MNHIDDARRAALPSAPRPQEVEWRPIETAPKDGSYVLIANMHGAWVAKWHPIFVSGFRPSIPWASMMLNHDHIEKPGRYDPPDALDAFTRTANKHLTCD